MVSEPLRSAPAPHERRPDTTASGTVAAVATFALIHGGGGSGWDWHLVAPALRERGHDAVAVDLPSEDESAGWKEYTDTVVRAVGDRRGVVVVGHSFGGFTALPWQPRLPCRRSRVRVPSSTL